MSPWPARTAHQYSMTADPPSTEFSYVTNSICTPSRATILTGTHNHVNGVETLVSEINSNLPNVAKSLRTAGYQTSMMGKWHLGEGKKSQPTGFDKWDILPGQGQYFDPIFINGENGKHVERGYVTDVITDKAIDFIDKRDPTRPFFAMVHHKAPHRAWECDPKHKHLYKDPVALPETYVAALLPAAEPSPSAEPA